MSRAWKSPFCSSHITKHPNRLKSQQLLLDHKRGGRGKQVNEGSAGLCDWGLVCGNHCGSQWLGRKVSTEFIELLELSVDDSVNNKGVPAPQPPNTVRMTSGALLDSHNK